MRTTAIWNEWIFFFFFCGELIFFFFFFLVNMGQLVNSLVLALPKNNLRQSFKQSHAEDHTEKIEATSFVFFLLPLYLARWFWPDVMNGRHDHTTASLYDGQKVFVWFDCLLDLGTDFLVGNMLFVWDAKCPAVAPHVHGLHSSLELWFWLS